MTNSNLHQLIQSFSAIERKDARRFLASPYFNLRADLLLLYDALCSEKTPEKRRVWVMVYPGEAFDDTRLRLLMSYLNKILEHFLLAEDTRNKNLSAKLRLAVAYRNRGLLSQYERNIRAVARELEAQPLRNTWYHDMQRDLSLEMHETTTTQNPTAHEPLHRLAYNTDVFYLIHRLRLICVEMSQKNVYRSGEDEALHRIIIGMAERVEWAELPGIATYLTAYRMLQHPEEDRYYQAFKQKIAAVESLFSAAEMRELYMFSINHCIRRTNRGNLDLEKELLRLYRLALEAGYLFENQILSRFTYHNIVAAALRCGELDWVEAFILQYMPFLEKKYRDSSLSFNLARLHYARNNFDSVLGLLQKANYHDPLFNLAAKTLLLKTYFMLDEYDLLQSHLDAMRNYIHRSKVIGYHRSNFLNIIRFTERILHQGYTDRQSADALRKEIENEPILNEKEWLLSVLR